MGSELSNKTIYKEPKNNPSDVAFSKMLFLISGKGTWFVDYEICLGRGREKKHF
jgi:hypothetical protein